MNVANPQKSPRLIEIAGPAGAGKSTITNLLTAQGHNIRLRKPPDVRLKSNAPFYAWHGFLLLSRLLFLYRPNSGHLSRQEFAFLSILRSWAPLLQSELKRDGGVIVLDQGPIYLFSQVDEFGPAYLRRPQANSLWKEIYSDWANTLDMVIWLDAPNTALVKRIRAREKWHMTKDESTIRTCEFLENFREAYARIFAKLTAQRSDFKIIRYDTGQQKPEEIVANLLSELGLKGGNAESN